MLCDYIAYRGSLSFSNITQIYLSPFTYLVFSATESTFSFKTQNTNIFMQAKALKACYLFIRIKKQFLFLKFTLNCPFDGNGVHLGQMGGGRWIIFNTYASLHTISSTACGSAETLKPKASFRISPPLWCSLGWRFLRNISLSNDRQVRRNEVSKDTWITVRCEYF